MRTSARLANRGAGSSRRARSLAIAAALALGSLAACAPAVDGPGERQRTIDREDGDRLARQLAAVPGVVSAHVTLRRVAADPLATRPAPPATAAILLVVDDRADRGAAQQAAVQLARATAPEVTAPAVIVQVGAVRPQLATVGPFTVEARSRGPLRAALAVALALIVALAGWIAVRERPRATR